MLVEALATHLFALTQKPIAHKPMLDWFLGKDVRSPIPSPFWIIQPKLAFQDRLDVLSGYSLQLGQNVVLDAVAFKESTIDQFEGMLTSLPEFGRRIKRLSRRRTHASSHVYRAYALLAHLWLVSEESAPVPEGLVVAFLQPSLMYYNTEQWRTSIVLSAISVEYVLAEMFEQIFKSPAPEITLGQLYERVRPEAKFPEEINEAIRRTNDIRIKAVHRGTRFVSEPDALDALVGAVQLTIWYYLQNAD
jgi:hypothetical protein